MNYSDDTTSFLINSINSRSSENLDPSDLVMSFKSVRDNENRFTQSVAKISFKQPFPRSLMIDKTESPSETHWSLHSGHSQKSM